MMAVSDAAGAVCFELPPGCSGIILLLSFLVFVPLLPAPLSNWGLAGSIKAFCTATNTRRLLGNQFLDVSWNVVK